MGIIIYVDNWKIRVDLCESLWIFVDIASSLIYMLVGLFSARYILIINYPNSLDPAM